MKLRLTLSLLAATAIAAAAADYPAQSRLADGHWVKIKVDKEGIYELTPETLAAWGFSDPAAVRVYGYGGTALALDRLNAAPTDLQPTMSTLAADGRVLFYADADWRLDLRNATATEQRSSESTTLWRQNIYDSYGYYFVSDAEAAALPDELPAPEAAGASPLTGHMHADAVCTDTTWPIGYGALFCGSQYTEARPYGIDFAMTDRVTSLSATGSSIDPVLVYSGYGQPDDDLWPRVYTRHQLTCTPSEAVKQQSVGNMAIGTATYCSYSGKVTFRSGTADIAGHLDILPPEGMSSKKFFMDTHVMVYPRLNRLPEGSASMLLQYYSAKASDVISITGASSDMRLWDVSHPDAVRPLQLSLQDDGSAIAAMPGTFNSTNPGRLILFDTGARHMQPIAAEVIEPQNIHGAPVPELAIITTDEYLPLAEELAEAHRSADGISVGVFRSRQILNEFSSGAFTPMAYRRFARMMYERGGLRHVLLLGPATGDHRGITMASAIEQLAIHETRIPNARADEHTNYAWDGFIGCFDDVDYTKSGTLKMHINVGRLPAANYGEATSMVRRTIAYINNPPAASTHMNAVFGDCPGDNYEHLSFSNAAADLMEEAGADHITHRVHISCYPESPTVALLAGRVLEDNLKDGRGYFQYVGHSVGNATLYNTRFLDVSRAKTMRYDVPPMIMMSSCTNYEVDNTRGSLGHTLLAAEQGGAIAVVGACRSVYSSYNSQFANRVVRAYATATTGATFGDVYRLAQNATITDDNSTACQFNTKCYNLCGDPAVRMPLPDTGMELELINGSAPADAVVQGGTMLSLSGFVALPDGNIDTDFNGTADITVYDTETDCPIVISDGNATKPQLTAANRLHVAATTTVSGGRWSLELFVPPFTDGGRDFAISTAAVSADGTTQAHGYFTGLATHSEAADGSDTDTTAPQILDVYIDTPDFTDGDIVSSDFTLYATIDEPATGINTSRAPLAGASRIMLDGLTATKNIAGHIHRSADGTPATLAVPFHGIAEGRHTAEIIAVNNAGAETSRSISFTVCAASAGATLYVDERPARTCATLAVEHNAGSSADVAILIDDASGRTVRRLDADGIWDLNDADGHPVADGLYTATALVRAGTARTHSEPVEIVVLRAAAQ